VRDDRRKVVVDSAVVHQLDRWVDEHEVCIVFGGEQRRIVARFERRIGRDPR
jgi:hypothetical protein